MTMSPELELSRRSLICGLTLVVLGLLPDSAVASGTVRRLANGKVEVDLAQNPALKKVGGIIEFEDSNGRAMAVMRTSKSQAGYRVIDLACTHQGVKVERSGGGWKCKLGHGAEYAIGGAVTGGPATQNLRRVNFKVSKNKIVVG